MELLGYLMIGPARSTIGVHSLRGEIDPCPFEGEEVLRGEDLLEFEQLLIEVSERRRIGTVERNAREARDGRHLQTVVSGNDLAKAFAAQLLVRATSGYRGIVPSS